MHNLFYIKVGVSALILLIALLCGLFPVLVQTNPRTERIFAYGSAFAQGVFLGVGLIHLLPDAQIAFNQVFSQKAPSVIPTICAVTIVLILFIEEIFKNRVNKKHQENFVWLPYLLMLLLSIHSVIAGAALGFEDTLGAFLVILFAIIAHKGCAAFSLGVSMRNHAISKSRMIRLVIFFALMTPAGILLGALINKSLSENTAVITEAIFDAVAAGTFIYIATFEKLSYRAKKIKINQIYNISFYLLGLLLMAVIAIWI